MVQGIECSQEICEDKKVVTRPLGRHLSGGPTEWYKISNESHFQRTWKGESPLLAPGLSDGRILSISDQAK
jgi:hypothetical protein